MRNLGLLLVACVLACQPNEDHPPNLPDFDGSVQPPPGGGIVGGGNNDGGTVDGGTALASASNVANLVVSGTSVYYTSHGTGGADGTVSVVPIGGGTPTNLATGLDGPWGLAVAGSNVYYTLARPTGTGGVFSVPVAGGSSTPIQSNVTGAWGLVTDGVSLYWTLDNGNGGGTGGALVESIALGGTTPKQVLDNGSAFSPGGLALSGSDLYVPGQAGSEDAVYWGTTSGSSNLTPLDTPQAASYADVAVDASANAVFATIDDVAPAGAIVAFPLHGGVASTVATGLDHPQRLALDGTRLYFTDPGAGVVWVKDLTTTDAPVQFVSGLSAPLPIVVADAVYVGTADAVLRFPKL